MITALVRVDGAASRADALAATLSALVSAAASGLVADAIVISEGPDENLSRIADALGAGLTVVRAGEDPWRRGAGLAKRDWVLCLDAGDIPRDGWIGALERFLASSPPKGRFGRSRRADRLHGGPIAAWRGWWTANRVRTGDVLRKTALLDGGRPGSATAIWMTIERDPALG